MASALQQKADLSVAARTSHLHAAASGVKMGDSLLAQAGRKILIHEHKQMHTQARTHSS